jgi:hypothetical protein
MPNTVKDWAKALVRRMRLMKEKEQREAQQAEGGKELEDCELSPDLYDQITQLWNRSNEIYESSLRIGASNFDPSEPSNPLVSLVVSLVVSCRVVSCAHNRRFYCFG